MPTWQTVIDRANSDEQFRSRLKANPAAACNEAGVDVPAGITVNVIERQPNEVYLILDSVEHDELDETRLAAVAGGSPSKNSMPIEIKVSQIYEQISDDATKDLRGVQNPQTPKPKSPKLPRPQ